MSKVNSFNGVSIDHLQGRLSPQQLMEASRSRQMLCLSGTINAALQLACVKPGVDMTIYQAVCPLRGLMIQPHDAIRYPKELYDHFEQDIFCSRHRRRRVIFVTSRFSQEQV